MGDHGHVVGKPPDLRRKALRDQFGLSGNVRLPLSLVDQLENCADDDTRRFLLKQKKPYRKQQLTISEVYGDIEVK
jgi:hypothetical protein